VCGIPGILATVEGEDKMETILSFFGEGGGGEGRTSGVFHIRWKVIELGNYQT